MECKAGAEVRVLMTSLTQNGWVKKMPHMLNLVINSSRFISPQYASFDRKCGQQLADRRKGESGEEKPEG